jgi:hypothetical protein
MGKIKKLLICGVFLFSFTGPVLSQTLILKSGQRIEGKIIEQTDKYIKVESQGAELTFDKNEITTIAEAPAPTAGKAVTLESETYKAYIQSLSVPFPPKKEAAQEAEAKNESAAQEAPAEPSNPVVSGGTNAAQPVSSPVPQSAEAKYRALSERLKSVPEPPEIPPYKPEKKRKLGWYSD